MTAYITRRGSKHPELWKRTPNRTEDFFDEAQLAELRRYTGPIKKVRLVLSVVTTLALIGMTFGLDLGRRFADTVDGQGWWVQLVVVVLGLMVVNTIIDLPVSYWVTLVHDRKHEVGNTTLGTWIGDQVKDLLITSVLITVLMTPLYVAIHATDTWWLWGGLAFLGLQLVLAFVYPVLIMPRFNKFTPMEDGPLRSRIEEIAVMAETPIEGVYTMDGSKRSRRGNAFVAGFGATKRVVLYDTIVDWPIDEVSQIVAHEIGHYRLKHVVRGFPLISSTLLLNLAIVAAVAGNDTVLGWADVRSLGDPASLPVILLAFGVGYSLPGLVSAWNSRRYERAADLEALELLGQPTEFVSMWPKMVEVNKADLEPSWWAKLNATHPAVPERMQFGLDWATQNGVAASAPAKAAVPAQ